MKLFQRGIRTMRGQWLMGSGLLILILSQSTCATDQKSCDGSQTPSPLAFPSELKEAQVCQQAWADYLKIKPQIVNSLGGKMTLIPFGELQMGNHEAPETVAAFAAEIGNVNSRPENYHDEYPVHTVMLTKPFLIGTCEVTRGEFRKFTDATGYLTDAEQDGLGGLGYNKVTQRVEQHPSFHWRNPGFEQTDDHPVVNVTWNDAVAFCGWLSQRESEHHRLPTEAEWEFACRAGTGSRIASGSLPNDLKHFANASDQSCQMIPGFTEYTGFCRFTDGYSFTAPTGTFKPNPSGLHDMHGNVWE
jgi:sulfatase modifying factor 1